MNIAVVTDSTASLSLPVCQEYGIRVVPLHLVVDGREHLEGDEADSSSVIDALRRKADVSTSRPSPGSFLQTYEEAAKGGATEIISVHLSGEMSGTVDAAASAALDSPVPVHVVDSRTISAALGSAAVGAARDAAAGRPATEIVERLERRCAASSVRLLVHSLEPLRRGGRIGGARALLGSALAIKPVLHVVDGRLEALERVRTAGKAVARLQALTIAACDAVPDWAADAEVTVHHLDALERAEPLAAALADHLSGPVQLGSLTAVIGAHLGIGAIGVAVSPRPRD